MREIDITLEMRALDAEMEGMKAENAHRLACGNSVAYGDDAFSEVAKKYRELKCPVSNNPILDNGISFLELSPRAHNAVTGVYGYQGVFYPKTIRELIGITEGRLKGYRNLGSVSFREIVQALARHGLHLGMEAATCREK